MLIKRRRIPVHSPTARQSGVVVVIALVVLIVMTLAGLSMVRSMDTSNLIAGNMAFRATSAQSADEGVETAIGWLESSKFSGFLDQGSSLSTVGYIASVGTGIDSNPNMLTTTAAFWTQLTARAGVCNLPMIGGACTGPAVDASGNQISYVIERLCATSGVINGAGCAVPQGGATTMDFVSQGVGDPNAPTPSAAALYRITVRVSGVRNSLSYVQVVLSM